jgi:hypothetical protein
VQAGVDIPSKREIKPNERCFLGRRPGGEAVSWELELLVCIAGWVELALDLLVDPTGRILPARASYLVLSTEALLDLTPSGGEQCLGLSCFFTLGFGVLGAVVADLSGFG